MKYLLNAIYLLILIAAIPWVVWRICVQKKNRRGWMQKLFGLVPRRENAQPCIWIHAVSVGEVNLLTPLIKKLRNENPQHEICISTTTETGFDLANKKFASHQIFFCPSDFSWAVNNAIGRINPSLLVLTELELWPNLIATFKSRAVPVALINGRISEKSFRGYARFRFLTKPIFAALDVACVQTDQYADRLIQLGIPTDRVHVCGNIKFDGNENITDAAGLDSDIPTAAGIEKDDFVIVAGSTQEEEDLMAIDVYRQLKASYDKLKLVLVPRHPERSHRIIAHLRQQNLPVFVRSKNESLGDAKNDNVILVDVIGELKLWWNIASVAYVGGSMGSRGGQNMIEPAALGVPVCFGPNTVNFKDVVDMLLEKDAAKVVHNAKELSEFILFALGNPETTHKMGQRALEITATQKGATNRTVALIRPLLSNHAKIPDKQAA